MCVSALFFPTLMGTILFFSHIFYVTIWIFARMAFLDSFINFPNFLVRLLVGVSCLFSDSSHIRRSDFRTRFYQYISEEKFSDVLRRRIEDSDHYCKGFFQFDFWRIFLHNLKKNLLPRSTKNKPNFFFDLVTEWVQEFLCDTTTR